MLVQFGINAQTLALDPIVMLIALKEICQEIYLSDSLEDVDSTSLVGQDAIEQFTINVNNNVVVVHL